MLLLTAVSLSGQRPGEKLPPWTEGTLDIHHINTGKGNATLFVLPDGTSLLLDAGWGGREGPRGVPAKPDNTRNPGEWIARSARAVLEAVQTEPAIDYALLTHLPATEHPGRRVHQPVQLHNLADVRVFPQFTATNYMSHGGGDHRHSSLNTHLLNATFTHNRRNHPFKFGWDARMIRANVRETRTPAGVFDFTPAMTQGPNPLRASSTAGNGIASMLLGTGSGAGILYRSFRDQASQSYCMAWYAQDDWRVTPKLTLNLGIRYDFDTPKTERFNRSA